MWYKNYTNGFTLVELIVVITILAILSTIAFISLQGYASSARDSKRLNDIKIIEKWLSIYNTVNQNIPLPDNSITITASGSLISYQGSAEKRFLNKINQPIEITDPKSKEPYSYAHSNKRWQYQLIAFFEGENDSSNIKTFWSPIWILLNKDSKNPLNKENSALNNIDLATSIDEYILQIDSNIQIQWDKDILNNIYSMLHNEISVNNSSLEWFWLLNETNSNWEILDLSQNMFNGVCHKSFSESVDCNNTEWPIIRDGRRYFDWINNYINIWNTVSNLDNFTVISKFNLTWELWNTYALVWNSFTSSPWSWYFYGIRNTGVLWGIVYNWVGQLFQFNWKTQIKKNTNYIWSYRFNWTEANLYLDWFLENSITINWYTKTSIRDTTIWKQNSAFWPFQWHIEKVLIFNETLSQEEINIIWKILQKY